MPYERHVGMDPVGCLMEKRKERANDLGLPVARPRLPSLKLPHQNGELQLVERRVAVGINEAHADRCRIGPLHERSGDGRTVIPGQRLASLVLQLDVDRQRASSRGLTDRA